MVVLLFSKMLLSHTLISLALFSGAWATPARPTQRDKLGAVASESSVCSNIGIDILKEGGNAADAVRRPASHQLIVTDDPYSS